MSAAKIPPYGKTVEVTPISVTRDSSVYLIVEKGRSCGNPLTVMLESLPEDIYSHCVRVSVVAKLLAEKCEALPEHEETDAFAYVVWLGGLYHHLGHYAAIKSKKMLPVYTESLLKNDMSNIMAPCDANRNAVLDIVRCCYERLDGSGYPDGIKGEEISLRARFVGFANMFDELTAPKSVYSEKSMKQADVQMMKSGTALFGSDVMACYEQARDKIFDMYKNHCESVEDWM